MAEGLEQQKQQYQQRFAQFLADVDDGTFEGDLDEIQRRFSDIPIGLQKRIDEQIQAYRNQNPTTGRGLANFVGKRAVDSVLGPVGLSLNDFLNPERLLEKVKKTALQSVGHAIARNVPNPTTKILSRLNGRGRDTDAEGRVRVIDDVYDDIVDGKRLLRESYSPDSKEYINRMKERHPDEYNEVAKIHNNIGENFYSKRKDIVIDSKFDEAEFRSEYLVKFHITNSDKILIFRMANFSGLTDSFSVTYNDVRYFGRPESLKQYDSVNRSISFSFDVMIDNQVDIENIYRKLDILAGTAYPNSYTNSDIIQPNIMRLSVGNYLNKMPFFITSLVYTADDEQVFAEGKPRAITVSITGDVIQPERNPSIDFGLVERTDSRGRSFQSNRFINQTPVDPNFIRGGDSSEFDGSIEEAVDNSPTRRDPTA